MGVTEPRICFVDEMTRIRTNHPILNPNIIQIQINNHNLHPIQSINIPPSSVICRAWSAILLATACRENYKTSVRNTLHGTRRHVPHSLKKEQCYDDEEEDDNTRISLYRDCWYFCMLGIVNVDAVVVWYLDSTSLSVPQASWGYGISSATERHDWYCEGFEIMTRITTVATTTTAAGIIVVDVGVTFVISAPLWVESLAVLVAVGVIAGPYY